MNFFQKIHYLYDIDTLFRQSRAMNSTFSITYRLLALGFAMALFSCKHFDEPPLDDAIPAAANISIADLSDMVGERRVTITEPIVIAGYVTTSDEASNFYRTLCIEDVTGGVEIMAGIYDLHNIYPLGSFLTISLEGCAIGEHYGILQVGTEAAPHSNYPTDYFLSRLLLDKHIRCHDLRQPVAPTPVTIAELTPSLCGRLINIAALQLTTLTPSNEQCEWSGYNIFADEQGNTIAVYTSTYATYSSHHVPTQSVSLTGILQHGKVEGEEMYIIKMRDEKDCYIMD